MTTIRELLADYLARGAFVIGQVRVTPELELRHVADEAVKNLSPHSGPAAARFLAVYDDAGKYRPLKTAPNLRRGWSLQLASIPELQLALDAFYPAALGTWLAFRQNQLVPVPLRATLARQTGMYRIVQSLADSQITKLVAATCAPEFTLALSLWEIEPGKPHAFTRPRGQVEAGVPADVIPLLSAEAGNGIVAEGRKIVKAAPQS
ncbi:MAG TPA: DR2241 family protein [Chthoniobacterales bacterium]